MASEPQFQSETLLTEFPIFGRLPAEIRDLVWESASFEPRIVHLRLKPVDENCKPCSRVRSDINIEDLVIAEDPDLEDLSEDEYDELLDQEEIGPVPIDMEYWGLASRTLPPVLLRVCRESRRVGLRYYQLSFATAYAGPKTFFHFNADMLYLDLDRGILGREDDIVTFINPVEAVKVQHLIMRRHRVDDGGFEEYKDLVAAAFEHFPRLKTHMQITPFHDRFGWENQWQEGAGFEKLEFMDLPRDGTLKDGKLAKLGSWNNELLNEVIKRCEVFGRTIHMQAVISRMNNVGWGAPPKSHMVRLSELPTVDYKILATPAIKAKYTLAHAAYWDDEISFEPNLTELLRNPDFIFTNPELPDPITLSEPDSE